MFSCSMYFKCSCLLDVVFSQKVAGIMTFYRELLAAGSYSNPMP
jgi:hypothetical protein